MKPESLELSVRRDAFAWSIAGIVFTLTVSGALSLTFSIRDADQKIDMQTKAALSSARTEILAGDVRSTELRLKKQFGVSEGEELVFLDANGNPWVGDLRVINIEPCEQISPCHDWFARKTIVRKPIFFDEEGKQLWGYLHLEKNIEFNWAVVLSVALAVIIGALFQGVGLYLKVARAVHNVSIVLTSWAAGLSANPKDPKIYGKVPYSEIEPIGRALSGLKTEIDALEQAARQQGALTTLRGVGHDILNPVARMKRLLGILEIQGSADAELLASLRANIRRLSGYAEQLKLIYKRQTGEYPGAVPVLDVSLEVRELAKELLSDPETIEKKLILEVDVVDGCRARIPAPALGRIVENLCSNSVQASNEGAVVSVKVASQRDEISIQVADSGTGIPREHHAKIFEPDFSTKANKGTGLGLFVVKQVCEQYGGKISFLSKPGATSFTLTFPRAEVSHVI